LQARAQGLHAQNESSSLIITPKSLVPDSEPGPLPALLGRMLAANKVPFDQDLLIESRKIIHGLREKASFMFWKSLNGRVRIQIPNHANPLGLFLPIPEKDAPLLRFAPPRRTRLDMDDPVVGAFCASQLSAGGCKKTSEYP